MARFSIDQQRDTSIRIIDHRDSDGDRAIYLWTSEAIELRDLLLREFPAVTRIDADTEQINAEMERMDRDEHRERRERIATAVMAGLAADPGTNDQSVRVNAEIAVEWADALITALDKD